MMLPQWYVPAGVIFVLLWENCHTIDDMLPTSGAIAGAPYELDS